MSTRAVGLVAVAGLSLAACFFSGSSDRDSGTGDAASGDGGVDQCNCPADQPVTMFHSCTPPLEVGCVAEICEPGVTDCGEGYTCEECSAAACCHCAACMPTCVFTGPAMGPLPEYLKLHTTYGSAGQEQEIIVEGFPFYIGALFYLARVGDSDDLPEASYPSTCGHGFTAPARAAGIEPVWVSQYGGDDPWVLAGFFTYSTGDYPSCVQPGYPCTEDNCCETAEVPMSCAGDGRCRME